MNEEEKEICRDILKKLGETGQVYIVSHDTPLSISTFLFNLLDARRKQEATKLGIPEIQYEFEDIIGKFLGLHSERSAAKQPGVFVEVRFLKDTPIITGVDMKQYGPFKKGDVAALPKENASVLIKMKVAEKRVKPPTEPTLKEVMKGEVLTGYVEAARVVRVLGEEVKLAGEDTALLADLFLDLLTDAGVSLPSRFKGEFEKAMDIYKPYDENVELIEEAAHRIILRETGKEYPEGEALRKAREKVEKLLKEIREARGE